MKSKKIAYLIFRTRESTGTRVIMDHASALRLRGHKVTLYSLFGKSASWYPKGMVPKSILFYLKEKPADVLVATFWPTAYITLLLRAQRKYYLVMGFEPDFHSLQIVTYFAKLSYNLPLHKIAVSKYLQGRIYDYSNKKDTVKVVRTYLPNLPQTKGETKRKNKTVTILSVVSWYNRVKGIDILENAVKKLKKMEMDYRFILVSREELAYSPVFDEFYSNPPKEVLRRLYLNADVLLSTSRTEGYYIPGIEAMANKCLFITTNSGGIGEYAENGKNSVVLRRASDLWNKQVIQKTLANVALRKKLILNGYKTARRYGAYSLKDLGRDLESLYFTKDA